MFWTRKPKEQDIFDALKNVVDPETRQDIVALGWVSGVVIDKNSVFVTLMIDPARGKALEPVRRQAEQQLRGLSVVREARVVLTAEKAPDETRLSESQAATRPLLPNVRHVIAVASGKGGVGKSTVAVNLAIALQAIGLRVGILDADIYGPSMPMLLGVRDAKPTFEDDYIIPIQAHGLSVMSMGFMVDEARAMVWRGPMIQKALTQMLRDVRWGALDVLVIDMPPGTGDAQLTLAQKVPLSGAVIVSTPQDIALLDAVKGVAMFRKTNVPILGLIENMSYFCCPNCNYETAIFSRHGAEQRAQSLDIPFLGALPLDIEMRESADKGVPIALNTQHETAQRFAVMGGLIHQHLNALSTKV